MVKKNRMMWLARFFILILCLLSFSANILNPVSLKYDSAKSCHTYASQLPIKSFFKNLFNKNTPTKKMTDPVYVYLGGYPLGFTMNCAGVIVVAKSNESAVDIKEGDVITHIEDLPISSSEEIYAIINSDGFAGRILNVAYRRNGEVLHTMIKPIYEAISNSYKLGLWIRDNAAGVGTLTYIRKDNLRFGALGHPVCDIDTGTTLPVSSGSVFRCNIVGYKSGVKGSPGELKGLFLRNGSIMGSLDKNNTFGLYGTFSEKTLDRYNGEVVEVASRDEVRSGKAKIRSTIEGGEPKDYDIEIVKTYFQKTKENKSMFIRVTDKELIAKTGGIVQGMSGSPIIQNGKLVGAITHVFVSDPTKGYGVYAEWMIDQ